MSPRSPKSSRAKSERDEQSARRWWPFGRRRSHVAERRPLGYDLIGHLDHDLDPDELPPPRRQVAHAALLESLRAIETRLTVPTVVIAGTHRAEIARPTIAGLLIQSHLAGRRIAVGKLVPGLGYRVLRKRVAEDGIDSGTDWEPPSDTIQILLPGETADGTAPDMALRLVGAPDPEELVRWFERAAEGHDLLLVEAPPLLESVDAALLARACDGLVLVVEAQHTRADQFEIALDRARAAGSPPIGLVVENHREWLPRALGKIVPGYPRALRRRGS